MDHVPPTQVEREVASWPGVSTGDTGRGGLKLSYGNVELRRPALSQEDP
jgi:hypothetical protein